MQNVLTIFEVPTRFFSFVLHVILQEIQQIKGHSTFSNLSCKAKSTLLYNPIECSQVNLINLSLGSEHQVDKRWSRLFRANMMFTYLICRLPCYSVYYVNIYKDLKSYDFTCVFWHICHKMGCIIHSDLMMSMQALLSWLWGQPGASELRLLLACLNFGIFSWP